MHPELFTIGSITIHTYGVLAAIGFLVGVATVIFLSKKEKIPVEPMVDLTFWTVVIGFIGSRLLFVLTRLEHFSKDWSEVFRVWEGGLVWYGGPLLAFPFGVWFVKRHKINVWKAVDITMPAMAIAHMFGRFGCFAAGCCYGKPTDSVFGIVFQSPLIDPPFRGLPLHPTQLYEAVALLILYVSLLRVFFKKQFDGQVFFVYVIAYPIIRVIVEIFRGDAIRGYVIEGILSTSQFISLLVAGVGIWLMKKRLRALKLVSIGFLLFGLHGFWNHQDQAYAEPKRIVTLAPALGEWVADLYHDRLDHLVGVSQFTDFPETLKLKVQVGGMHRLNFETIVSLKPDLVIATRDGNIREQVERLKSLNLKVLVVDSLNLEQIYQSVLALGKELEVEDRALQRVNQMKRAFENFRTRASERGSGNKTPRVVVEIAQNPLVVVGGNNFIDEGLAAIGAENLFRESAQRFPRPSVEKIRSLSPDQIVVLSGMQGKRRPLWKGERSIPLDGDLLLRPTFRMIEGLSRLERALKGKDGP